MTGRTEEGFLQFEEDDESSWISITFSKADPETFNLVAEIFATILHWIYSTAIVGIYTVTMSWHLRTGRSIPASELGNIPGDSVSGIKLWWTLRSVPAVFLVILVVIGDFSKTVALQGLSFPIVVQEGPPDTALSLSSQDRNQQRLPQTAGDPTSFRTVIIPDFFYEDG